MRQINPVTGICFFRVSRPMELLAFLEQADYSPLKPSLTRDLIGEWLDYGCIYVNGRRERQNLALATDQIIRLHTRHKRYAPHLGSLALNLIENNEDFLVLDKPAGLPTHPTLDNFLENAKVKLEQELGLPLFTTHRLDIPTQGLLVVAKSAAAQKQLNRAFSLGRVQKLYRSINQGYVEPGLFVHYIDPQSLVPRVIGREERPGWWTCKLKVEASGSLGGGLWWHEITLLTGKTHQIRAQMSALGAPVLGDACYGSKREFGAEQIALECYKLEFIFNSKTYTLTRPRSLLAR